MAIENNKIELKDIITVVSVFVAVAIQWGIYTTQISNLESELKDLKADFKEYKKEHYEKIDRIYQELLRK